MLLEEILHMLALLVLDQNLASVRHMSTGTESNTNAALEFMSSGTKALEKQLPQSLNPGAPSEFT